MVAPAFLSAILDWLRAGYPDGVPETDYVPLFALLSRKLSSDEVREVARSIIRSHDGQADNIDIGVQITKITNELPRKEDVDRVRVKLAAAGWPLADPTDPRSGSDPTA
ncbi:MAG: DUF3349 domain-containing protein [Microlunatus sp.]|nr:DUF3349 domain-containing protein [Microlunatus sp.]